MRRQVLAQDARQTQPKGPHELGDLPNGRVVAVLECGDQGYPEMLAAIESAKCRVAQPLLAFAPTDPTVRRYRSGLFRNDPRRVDHCSHAWWIAGSGRGKAVRSWR